MQGDNCPNTHAQPLMKNMLATDTDTSTTSQETDKGGTWDLMAPVHYAVNAEKFPEVTLSVAGQRVVFLVDSGA